MERRTHLGIAVLLCALATALCPIASAQFGGGTGEPNDPYLIYTPEQMNAIGTDPNGWDKHFRLCADLDLSAYTGDQFNVIGRYPVPCRDCPPQTQRPFSGVFDGDGHTISNFTYATGNDWSLGLFPYVDGPNAAIKNLSLLSPSIMAGTVREGAGLLIGKLKNGTVTSCYVSGGVISSDMNIGGLIGASLGTISNCHASGAVAGKTFVGGLVGTNFGRVLNSSSDGQVTGVEEVGGLVGTNCGIVSDCSVIADVIQDSDWMGRSIGGLLGVNYGRISDCQYAGSVAGKGSGIGGLIGWNDRGTVADCSNAGAITGPSVVGGLVGADYYGDIADCNNAGAVAGNEAVGGLIGFDTGSHASNCLNTATIVGTGHHIGGLIGFCMEGHLVNCRNAGRVISEDVDQASLGGVIGFGVSAQVVSCRNSGVVTGSGDRVGGLIGYGERTTIISCSNSGSISGLREVGGLIGHGISQAIADCNNTGDITADHEVGGLGGFCEDSSISYCHNTGSVVGGGHVGGCVGSHSGMLLGSFNTGEVTGSSVYIGGVIGYNSGSVLSCYNAGTVNGGYLGVGGLAGLNSGGLVNCHSTGQVVGGGGPVRGKVGAPAGLVGSNSGSVTNCYSTGAVSGRYSVRGLVGGGTVVNSFWDVETSGVGTSGGGVGLTTAEMQNVDTFLNAGWDFVAERANGVSEVWQMPDAGGYPQLSAFEDYTSVELGGVGTPEAPFLIATAEDLGSVWRHPLAHYRLRDDLDLSGILWSTAPVPTFGGTFDGDGHVIVGLNIQGGGALGLFGILDSGAAVMNLGLDECSIVGGVGANHIGSLAGRNRGSVDASRSTGQVTGSYYVGGLIGDNPGSVSNCYTACSVAGNEGVGGLIGHCSGEVSNCYSIGLVTGGEEDVGGLIGRCVNCGVRRSFWDRETSGIFASYGGFGRTTSQMQDIDTYLEAGWDFVGEAENGADDIWWMEDGEGYPRLWWED